MIGILTQTVISFSIIIGILILVFISIALGELWKALADKLKDKFGWIGEAVAITIGIFILCLLVNTLMYCIK